MIRNGMKPASGTYCVISLYNH